MLFAAASSKSVDAVDAVPMNDVKFWGEAEIAEWKKRHSLCSERYIEFN
jgi:hypothetical protein